EKVLEAAPKYLDRNLLETPALALDRVRMEIGRMAERVLPMLRKGTEAAIGGTARDLLELTRMDSQVGQLHGPILEYLRELSRQDLTSQEAELVHRYLAIAGYYENIGDTLKINLVHIGQKRLRGEVIIGDQTRKLFEQLLDELIALLELATRAVTRWDKEAARKVIRAKSRINQLSLGIEHHITRRMAADAPRRRLTYQIETELLENLKRVYYFTKRISKIALENDLNTGESSAAA
ncbi:MAG TPA: Na/Pi cotransporter family protein, partial [Chromatiaceae bacterium]|nr:Na/Pi cotransporter family protein [Chromatiaceae bacterium]